jgi:hypothetical protein
MTMTTTMVVLMVWHRAKSDWSRSAVIVGKGQSEPTIQLRKILLASNWSRCCQKVGRQVHHISVGDGWGVALGGIGLFRRPRLVLFLVWPYVSFLVFGHSGLFPRVMDAVWPNLPLLICVNERTSSGLLDKGVSQIGTGSTLQPIFTRVNSTNTPIPPPPSLYPLLVHSLPQHGPQS